MMIRTGTCGIAPSQNVVDEDLSQSSGRPVVFGDTLEGRRLMVVYEEVDADSVYPITAYEVPRRKDS
jgi:hypothetical protein